MQSFVQLWIYLSASPLFGLTATLAVYVSAQWWYARVDHAPWANPVLWSVATLATGLTLTGVAYPTYFSGAQFIHFLLGPAVVALGWPMWQRRAQLRARALPLALAALVGGAAASLSAVALGWAVGLPLDVVRSLATKSVTAPVAMGIAAQIGGSAALAAVFSALTGLIGALTGPYLFNLLRLRGPELRGFALGTAAHGIGAARALQVHPDAGAYAGLALGLQVIFTSLWLPALMRWLPGL